MEPKSSLVHKFPLGAPEVNQSSRPSVRVEGPACAIVDKGHVAIAADILVYRALLDHEIMSRTLLELHRLGIPERVNGNTTISALPPSLLVHETGSSQVDWPLATVGSCDDEVCYISVRRALGVNLHIARDAYVDVGTALSELHHLDRGQDGRD